MSHETSGGLSDHRKGTARPSGNRSIFDTCENRFFRAGEAPSPPAEPDDFKDLDEGIERKRMPTSRKLLLGLAIAGVGLTVALVLALAISWRANAHPVVSPPTATQAPSPH